uniref:Serine/threonine-protein kinase 19 n=1 Tax=Araucaria cunninghamii TaxID=56994 RepID=A0A0D6R9L0_ARACU
MTIWEGGENIASHSHSAKNNNSKKRRRGSDEMENLELEGAGAEPDASFSPELEDFSMFKDTLVALKMMCSQFPKIEKVAVKPFVLRSQLYSSVKDRTQVDRELEDLRNEEVLRIFKLNTGQDDNAIMFMDDYLKQVEAAKITMQAKHPDDVVIFDWFQTYVLTSNLGVAISHSELYELLSSGGEVKDKQISLLINTGLLTRQMVDSDVYWFLIPNVGTVLKSLSQGRKELLSFLNRRRYKEMSLSALEKRHLRLSKLDIRFHLRDLIGCGQLKVIHTPSGTFIRIAKE